MVTLGEHLRADQNPRLAAVHALEHALHGAARASGVAIQRASGASGNNRARVSSTRSVPWPTGLQRLPALSADRGTGACAPQ